jgi:hypothetical protein
MKKPHIKRMAIGLMIGVSLLSIYTYFNFSAKKVVRENVCFEKLTQVLEDGSSPDVIFQKEFDSLQVLMEYSLVARSEMLVVSNRLRVDTDAPMASRDLEILKSGTEDYLEIREGLYTIANKFECALDVEDSTLQNYNIDKKLQLKGLMVSLGAALALYDNYMLGVVLFESDARLRNIVNDPDMGFGLVANKLEEMTLAANSIEKRHRIRRAIKFYEANKEKITDVDEDSQFAYLKQLIESSPSYNFARKIRIREITANKFKAFDRITSDFIAETTTNGFDMVSGLFGNTIGMYESRKGKLHGDEEAKRKIQSVLQPLDILLEKTPFRLTDKLIPGHFGHVAIWTGTKQEIIDIGVWEDQHVVQYADKIGTDGDAVSKDNYQIIEALRNGVQLSTLDHFLNIDDFAILRPVFEKGTEEALTREALIMAFRQLGKKYDFNFDVNTTDKIVCSELAYVSFPSVDWPTEKTLGRYSISPDNVAKLAWTNVPLKLVMFYHDGELVDESEQVDKMKELMSQ